MRTTESLAELQAHGSLKSSTEASTNLGCKQKLVKVNIVWRSWCGAVKRWGELKRGRQLGVTENQSQIGRESYDDCGEIKMTCGEGLLISLKKLSGLKQKCRTVFCRNPGRVRRSFLEKVEHCGLC